jgi:RND family efflux transporter MFP subunit
MALVPRLLALALLAAPVPAAAQVYDCVMDPPMVVRLGSAATGLVVEVAVSRGDRVREGEVVARLDSRVERATRDLLALRAESTAAVEAQRARLAFIEGRLARVRTLAERGVATQDALEELEAQEIEARSLLRQAEMDRAVAQRQLARAEAALALREIRSPVNGFVTERALSPGEFLHQEGHVATLVKLDPLHVEAFLPVERYRQVRPGDAALVRPAAPVEGAFEAQVEVVDRVFDPASGTFGVRLALPNPDGALPGGHRCQVEFAFPDAG